MEATGLDGQQFINIPYSIMRDSTLSQTQKIVYGFINGFNAPLICYASNSYIANIVGLKSDKAISQAVSGLIEKGYIKAINPKGRSRSLVVLKRSANKVVEKDEIVQEKPLKVPLRASEGRDLTDVEDYEYIYDPNDPF